MGLVRKWNGRYDISSRFKIGMDAIKYALILAASVEKEKSFDKIIMVLKLKKKKQL